MVVSTSVFFCSLTLALAKGQSMTFDGPGDAQNRNTQPQRRGANDFELSLISVRICDM